MLSTNPITLPSSKTIAEEIIGTSTYAASGALGAWAFTSINPIGGAIFGATFGASQKTLGYALEQAFGNTHAEKVVKFAAFFFGSIFVAKAVTTLMGYSFSLISGLGLFIAMAPASMVTAIGLNLLQSVALETPS